MIPLCIPEIDEQEFNAVKEVLESGWLAHGPKNKIFEESFATLVGVKKAASLNSCTSALQLAIQALELKGEIIVPSFTFSASANSIVTAGCKPVFADIEFDSCNISPESIEKKISNKTVGIMPVHFAGQSAKMDEIMELAEKYDLKVIEDSAESLGAEFKGKQTGSIGDVGCFSFFPTKNITTGEGGMATSNDVDLIEKIKILRGHGIESSTFEREKKEKPWLRASTYAGYNYRLCDVLAAIGNVQLKKLDKMNKLRRKHSFYLNEQLSDVEQLSLPLEQPNSKHVYQMYTIKLSSEIGRTMFIKKLKEKEIQTSVHFDPPVHLQPYYLRNGWKKDELKITEDVSKRIITLPMYPGLKKEQLDFMIETIKGLLG